MKNKLVCNVIVTVVTIAWLAGCATAHKNERLSHEVWTYSDAGLPARCEVWSEDHDGGGTALMANPAASQIASYHTNQAGLGGASSFTVGDVQSHLAPVAGSSSPGIWSFTAGGSQPAANTNAAAVSSGGAAAGNVIEAIKKSNQ
jgi:hypothetical protein